MIRIQTIYNLGHEQVERNIEVDDITTLSSEERALLFEAAIGPLSFEREEEEVPCQDMPAISAASTIAMVHELSEKEKRIKYNLQHLSCICDADFHWRERRTLVKLLMEDLGFLKGEQNA